MTEETAPLEAPEDFDIDAWLSDAKRPERSVIVYKRADLLADLDELQRRISEANAVAEEEESLAASPVALEHEYLALAQQFHDSGLVVRVKGLTQDEMDAINSASKAAKETEAQIGRRMIEAALVSPRLTYEQLEKLSMAIGDIQMNQIVIAYKLATLKAPEVTVPFSRRSSGRDDGQE